MEMEREYFWNDYAHFVMSIEGQNWKELLDQYLLLEDEAIFVMSIEDRKELLGQYLILEDEEIFVKSIENHKDKYLILEDHQIRCHLKKTNTFLHPKLILSKKDEYLHRCECFLTEAKRMAIARNLARRYNCFILDDEPVDKSENKVNYMESSNRDRAPLRLKFVST